jgi:hypothetical protein
MKEELKQDEYVEIPGTETFKDEEGNPVPFKLKKLGTEEMNSIRKAYTVRKIGKDDKGKQIFDKGGSPVFFTEIDDAKITNRLIVESFIFPNLKDKDLMDFYGCVDVVDMPLKIFKRPKDYKYISNQVMLINDLLEEKTDEELVEEAKN